MNTAFVLLILVWAVLLVPSALKSRTSSSPHVTVGGFEHAMDVLRSNPTSKGGGRQLLVPSDAGRIVRRPEVAGRAADHRGPDGRAGRGPDRGQGRVATIGDRWTGERDVPSEAGQVAFGSGGYHEPAARDRVPPRRDDVGRADASREADTRPEPPREDPQVAARRMWFLRLLLGTALSIVAAAVVGGVLWVVAALAVAGTGGYVAMLRRLKVQRDEVRSVVRELDLPREPARVPVGAAVGGGQRRAAGGDDRGSGTVRLRRWDG